MDSGNTLRPISHQHKFLVRPEYSSSTIVSDEKYTGGGLVVDCPKTPELQHLPQLAAAPSTNISMLDDTDNPLRNLDLRQVYGDNTLPLSSRYGVLLGTLAVNDESDLIYNSPILDIDKILSFYETDSDTEELSLLSSVCIDCVEVGVARIEKITLLEENNTVSGEDLSPDLSYSNPERSSSSSITDREDTMYYTTHRDLNAITGSMCSPPILDPTLDGEFDDGCHSISTSSCSPMQNCMLHCCNEKEHAINPVNCSYHYTIEKLFTTIANENVYTIKSPTSHDSVLEVLHEVIPASPETGDPHKVMIMLRARSLNQLQSTYMRDENDIEYTKTVNDVLSSALSQVTLNGPPGKLRFSTEIILGAADGWMNVHMYIYERIILFVSSEQLCSFIDLVDDFQNVICDKKDARYIYIYSKTNGIRPTELYVLKQAISHMLVELLKNPALEFPLNRDTFNKHWMSMEQRMNNGSFNNPRKIKSLFFIPYRMFQLYRGLAVIRRKVKDIDSMEELAIVVYSGEGIHYSGEFQGKMWGGWKSLVNGEFTSNYKHCHIPGRYKEEAMKTNGMAYDSSFRDDSDSGSVKDIPSERRMRMDELMILASEKLGSYDANTEIANLVLIADNSLLPQCTEPEMLVSSGISINAIGTSETHDAMSLLRLVTYAGGTYSYATSYHELSETISRCHSVVKRGALHRVKVKIRLRLQTEVDNFLYGDMSGRNKPKLLSAEDRLYEWDVGSIGADDVRTMIVNIKGELPESQPVMRLTLDFDNHLENYCEKLNSTISVAHIPADTFQDDKRMWLSSIVHLEEMIVDVCRGLEMAIWYCVFQEPYKAARVILQHLMRLAETPKHGLKNPVPEIVNIIDGFELMLKEHQFAASASFVIKRQTVLMIVGNLWVLYQKRSLCGTNRFDTIFR